MASPPQPSPSSPASTPASNGPNRRQPPPLTGSPYPYATAPDIIRAHQKDAYFTGVLANQLDDLHRRLRGARQAHAWQAEVRTVSDLLYYGLTTLVGNRTLGEEYCDLVQVEEQTKPSRGAPSNARPLLLPPPPPPDTQTTATATPPAALADDDDKVHDAALPPEAPVIAVEEGYGGSDGAGGPYLPSPIRRAAYIATSFLLPYLAGRLLPRARAALRQRMQQRLGVLGKRITATATDTNTRTNALRQQQQKQQQQQQQQQSTKHLPSQPGHPPKQQPQESIANKATLLEYRILRYALTNLTSITSGLHVRALALAIFYFSGAYYTLAKRMLGLRYVFTRRRDTGGGGGGQASRAGYEVLGVLLVVQLAAQAYMHLRQQVAAARHEHALLLTGSSSPSLSSHEQQQQQQQQQLDDSGHNSSGFGSEPRAYHASPYGAAGAAFSLNSFALSDNNTILAGSGGVGASDASAAAAGGGLSSAGGGAQRSLAAIAAATHTPLPPGGRPRYDLGLAPPPVPSHAPRSNNNDHHAGGPSPVMGWIAGAQQRKCTLCLEELRDPAATQCGHVFCWACIGDWVREKPECPLCRREALAQHVLPLRMAA